MGLEWTQCAPVRVFVHERRTRPSGPDGGSSLRGAGLETWRWQPDWGPPKVL